jgi:hypothetical protein|nr:MAG TPA: hypothetical protein [Caudoviricetes sp.]
MMENKIKPHEIYTALMTIKMVCEGMSQCDLCPLKSPNSNFDCGLRDIPVNWKIKDYNEYNAFQ